MLMWMDEAEDALCAVKEQDRTALVRLYEPLGGGLVGR